jgi:hypothetical protein
MRVKSLLTIFALLGLYPIVGYGQSFDNVSGSSGTLNAGKFSTNSAWGDYDGDGDLDLYAANWGAALAPPGDALFNNNGDGTFTDRASEAGVDNLGNSPAAAFADYDNDGDLDLYVANFYDQDFLYQNDGSGNFSEVGRSQGLVNLEGRGNVMSVVWSDYNNDGWADFYLSKYYFSNVPYQNNGDGTFSPATDLGLGDKRDTIASLWADYDGDGDPDLYTVNREQENRLYRNDLNDDGLFKEVSISMKVANTEIGQNGDWGDYDNDGDLDLFVANVGANALYRNDGSVFSEVANQAGVRIENGSWLTAMADWADYDGDGFLDLYLASGGDRQFQPNLLYANNGDGTFSSSASTANLPTSATVHLSARWGDFDGNGSPDLYMTDGFGYGNLLFQNNTASSRFIHVDVNGRGGADGGANRSGFGAKVRLFNAADELVGFRYVNDVAGISFGVEEGGFYSIEVSFPGSSSAVTLSGLQGGDAPMVVEP